MYPEVLHTFLTATPPAWFWDELTGEMYWTERNRRALGVPPDFVCTVESWATLLHPACREVTLADLALQSAGNQLSLAYRLHSGAHMLSYGVRFPGTTKWVGLTISQEQRDQEHTGQTRHPLSRRTLGQDPGSEQATGA